MKNKRNKLSVVCFFLILTSAVLTQTAKGQSVWTRDYENKATWGIELLTPYYSFTGDERGVDFASYLYTNIPLGKHWGLRLSFPISRFNGGGTKLSGGNPMVAFQYINRETGIMFDFGARLPLIQADIDDPSEPLPPTVAYRAGAFNELKTAVHFNVNYRYGGSTGWIYKVGSGLEVIAGASGGTALLYNYYGQVLYKINNFTIGGGFKGHLLRNKPHYLVPGGNRIQLGVLGSYNFGRYEIGLFLKNNIISEFDTIAPFVIGFNFKVTL